MGFAVPEFLVLQAQALPCGLDVPYMNKRPLKTSFFVAGSHPPRVSQSRIARLAVVLVIRAVQSSPFPFFVAARRRGGPWARGWVGDPGPQAPGLAPGPRPPRPHLLKKSRFQDVKPLCSKPKGVTNRRVNQVLKRSPRVTDHGCCS
jgi:hypothetical protein